MSRLVSLCTTLLLLPFVAMLAIIVMAMETILGRDRVRRRHDRD